VKYRYLYQTKDNENREGWVSARNRAEAYAALRKDGIRPYRLIGDDPPKWRIWLVPAAVAAAAAAALFAFARSGASGRAALRRQQLTGPQAEISAGLANAWDGVFDSPLDRYLAAYAQPGWIAIPPELGEGDMERFEREAREAAPPADRPGDGEAVRALRRIVAGMREELAKYVARGGTAAEYIQFLEERQDDECAFLRRAREAVETAPPEARGRTAMNMNVRLREMGLPEMPQNGGS
jgi:hypothetical protein